MNYKKIKQVSLYSCKSIVFCILALAYLVSGCSKELFEEEVVNNDFKLKKTPVNELKKDKNFNAAFYCSTGKNFSRELQKNVTHARSEESYIIADCMVNIVTNKDIVSYNIKIMYPTKPVTDTV